MKKKNLEEAIKYHKEFASELRVKSKDMSSLLAGAYGVMAQDEDQLVEWLTQLKEIKESYESDYNIQDLIETCVKFWG